MPNLFFEYTSNINQKVNYQELCTQCHAIVARELNINITSCQSLITKQDTFCIGNGDSQNGFIYLCIKMLEGRPANIRENVGKEIFHLLKETFADSAQKLNLKIAVEIVEMAKPMYFMS